MAAILTSSDQPYLGPGISCSLPNMSSSNDIRRRTVLTLVQMMFYNVSSQTVLIFTSDQNGKHLFNTCNAAGVSRRHDQNFTNFVKKKGQHSGIR